MYNRLRNSTTSSQGNLKNLNQAAGFILSKLKVTWIDQTKLLPDKERFQTQALLIVEKAKTS